jgi:cytochrome c oxidase subunit IV
MAEGTDHKKTYLNVWGALLVLTVVTVAASYIQFGGPFNILIAMLIATVKAALVCLYFMHLKEDNRLNQVVFVSSFVFLLIFALLTISDVMYRPPIKAIQQVEQSS